MADIPDQPILGRVENPMQRHGQFNDAKPGAQMPAGDGDGVDHFGAQFSRELGQLIFAQPTQVFRRFDVIEEWCLAHGRS